MTCPSRPRPSFTWRRCASSSRPHPFFCLRNRGNCRSTTTFTSTFPSYLTSESASLSGTCFTTPAGFAISGRCSDWRAGFYSQDLITDDDVMSVLIHEKALNFKPGEKYMYSNTGFTLLAIAVKRVSGMSLREFTTKNIFEPLGMTHTHFRDDHEEVIKHDALGYEQDGKDQPFRMNLTNFDTTGATSLHTTVEDLQLWDENFYHPRVGGPALIEHMLERGKLNNGTVQDYASGLVIGAYRGLPTVDHGGADAGYRSDFARFPEQHFPRPFYATLRIPIPAGWFDRSRISFWQRT
jgi:CubicO group peptidase (beta-lactamase class C family)